MNGMVSNLHIGKGCFEVISRSKITKMYYRLSQNVLLDYLKMYYKLSQNVLHKSVI